MTRETRGEGPQDLDILSFSPGGLNTCHYGECDRPPWFGASHQGSANQPIVKARRPLAAAWNMEVGGVTLEAHVAGHPHGGPGFFSGRGAVCRACSPNHRPGYIAVRLAVSHANTRAPRGPSRTLRWWWP